MPCKQRLTMGQTPINCPISSKPLSNPGHLVLIPVSLLGSVFQRKDTGDGMRIRTEFGQGLAARLLRRLYFLGLPTIVSGYKDAEVSEGLGPYSLLPPPVPNTSPAPCRSSRQPLVNR